MHTDGLPYANKSKEDDQAWATSVQRAEIKKSGNIHGEQKFQNLKKGEETPPPPFQKSKHKNFHAKLIPFLPFQTS